MTPRPLDEDALDPRIWKVAWVVILGPLMTSLDATVVNVSLTRLAQDLGVPLTLIQWVTSGYLLALALMLPLSGWAVDRFGAKRVYLGCFVLFTTASIGCGLAPTAGFLIAMRVLQGMSGGLLAPMAQMMIVRGAGRHVARVMGLMVVPILLGPLCGPVLAGAILQHGSWRWIFFINLPIGLLALGLALWILPRDADPARSRPFDLAGFLLLSPALVLVLHSLESLSSRPAAHGLNRLELVAGLGLLAAFLRHARRLGPEALLDLGLFRVPTFLASARTQFLSNANAFGGQMLIPMFFLLVRRVSPTQAGLLMIPVGLGMLVSFPLMGALVEAFGPRRVAGAGAFLALAGTAPFAWPGFGTGPAVWLCLALFVRGLGQGGISIPSIASAYHALPKAQIAVATTTLNIVQRMGGPVTTTLLAIVLHAGMGGQSLAASGLSAAQALARGHAFTLAFLLLTLVHAGAVLAALQLPLRQHRLAPGT